MIETSYRLNVEALIESRAFGSACVKSFLLTGNGPELSTREIVRRVEDVFLVKVIQIMNVEVDDE